MNDLKGKVGVVSGAARGIGKAIVKDLCQNGVKVAFSYRERTDLARDLINEVKNSGGEILSFMIDAVDFKQVSKMVKEVYRHFGKIDILVNNVGLSCGSPIWKMSEDEWDKVMLVNLKSFYNHIRNVVPIFIKQQEGKIINITSVLGLRGRVGQLNYALAKSILVGLTKTLARELGRFNINVNAVAPGYVETEFQMENTPEIIRKIVLDECAIKRLGKPEDVANLVSFLCSDKASHITGEIIRVDAGQYI